MDRRLLLAGVVLLVVGLAGCSLLPLADDTEQTPTVSPTPVDPPDPDSDDELEWTEPPASFDFPDGYGSDGVTDGATATETHVQQLVAVDSYIFVYDSTAVAGENRTKVDVIQSVDNQAEVATIVTSVEGGGISAQYFEDDHVYVRTEQDGDNVSYTNAERPYEMREFAGQQFVGPLLTGVTYGEAEVVETAGGTYIRYDSESVDDPAAILRSEVEESRIRDFEVSIVVDDTGIVVGAVFEAEVDRGDRSDLEVAVQMDVRGIDATTVDRPEWFDEARD